MAAGRPMKERETGGWGGRERGVCVWIYFHKHFL